MRLSALTLISVCLAAAQTVVTISPSTATLRQNQTQQFTASVTVGGVTVPTAPTTYAHLQQLFPGHNQPKPCSRTANYPPFATNAPVNQIDEPQILASTLSPGTTYLFTATFTPGGANSQLWRQTFALNADGTCNLGAVSLVLSGNAGGHCTDYFRLDTLRPSHDGTAGHLDVWLTCYNSGTGTVTYWTSTNDGASLTFNSTALAAGIGGCTGDSSAQMRVVPQVGDATKAFAIYSHPTISTSVLHGNLAATSTDYVNWTPASNSCVEIIAPGVNAFCDKMEWGSLFTTGDGKYVNTDECFANATGQWTGNTFFASVDPPTVAANWSNEPANPTFRPSGIGTQYDCCGIATPLLFQFGGNQYGLAQTCTVTGPGYLTCSWQLELFDFSPAKCTITGTSQVTNRCYVTVGGAGGTVTGTATVDGSTTGAASLTSSGFHGSTLSGKTTVSGQVVIH